jgi:glycerophosphoryl diester phosphodiesterase
MTTMTIHVEDDFAEALRAHARAVGTSVNRAVKSPAADIVCVNGSLMTKKNCKKVHKKGKKFCVYWTEGEEVKKAIQMGVDCYFTNYTDTALELEREYRKT